MAAVSRTSPSSTLLRLGLIEKTRLRHEAGDYDVFDEGCGNEFYEPTMMTPDNVVRRITVQFNSSTKPKTSKGGLIGKLTGATSKRNARGFMKRKKSLKDLVSTNGFTKLIAQSRDDATYSLWQSSLRPLNLDGTFSVAASLCTLIDGVVLVDAWRLLAASRFVQLICAAYSYPLYCDGCSPFFTPRAVCIVQVIQ